MGAQLSANARLENANNLDCFGGDSEGMMLLCMLVLNGFFFTHQIPIFVCPILHRTRVCVCFDFDFVGESVCALSMCPK